MPAQIGSVRLEEPAKCDAMNCAANLAAFVCGSAFEDLSETAREQLKIRILDLMNRC